MPTIKCKVITQPHQKWGWVLSMSDWSKFLGIPLWFWLFILPTLISLICLFLQNKLEKIFKPIWKILDKIIIQVLLLL